MALMASSTPRETKDERLARARAALGAAERSAARSGGRIDRTALRSIGGTGSTGGHGGHGGPTGLVPSPVHPVPAHTDAGEGAPAVAPQEAAAPDDHTRLAVPGPLAPLIPYGSLRAGSSLAVTGEASTSLLLSLAVAAAGEDSWCAVAGMPDLGLRAALDAGLDPCRLVIVPDAGEQSAQVLSALVDGVGVLVLGPRPALAPALWRTLLGRARTRDTLVLAVDPPGRADLQLTSATRGWEGLGIGSGRLRRRRVAVTSAGRGVSGHRESEILLPEVRGMIAGSTTAQGSVTHATTSPTAAPAVTPAPVPLRAIRRAG